MILLSLILSGIALLLLLPSLTDLLLLLRAVRGRPAQNQERGEASPLVPRILYLIPAHDEELLIGHCLDSLTDIDYPKDRYDAVVVADNCSDATAETAFRAGARCLVRTDERRKGKPWALAWGLDRVSLDRYDAVVVLDADSRVDRGFAKALAAMAPLADKAVQGFNGVSNPEESSLTRMAQVFSAVRCNGMNALKGRAGVNVPLANGLCLGTDLLRRRGWTAFSLGEDWELYAQLTAEGVTIESQPAARVFSQEARDLQQSSGQRKRWVVGRAEVLLGVGPAILRSRAIGIAQKLDALAELIAPGPALHLGVVGVLAPVAFLAGIPGGGWIGFVLILSLLRLAVYTGAAIWKMPQPREALGAFVSLPFYAVWRMGIQMTALAGLGRLSWVRTERHHQASMPITDEPTKEVKP